MRELNPGTLFSCILASMGAGALTLWFVWDDLGVYESACTALFAAPLWLMSILGFLFYLLIGTAAALMLDGRLPHADRVAAMLRWTLMLLLCFLQAVAFLRLEYNLISFALGALNLTVSLTTTSLFARSSRASGFCLFTCALWLLYLCYLGFTVAAGL